MKYITPTLETDRLILKRGKFEDYLKVYEYDLTKLRDIDGEFEFIKQEPDDLDGFDTYADEYDEVFDWIVYLKDNMIPIGNVVADREEKEIKATELSFNLHPNYWGNGYIKEAVINILDYLFNSGFDNILCGYSEGNTKSKKLNDKLGFTLYRVENNAWLKNGKPITDYKTIMNKEKFYELYPKIKNKIR